ncbi:protein kinase [Rhodococcus koreensis]|uniref:protein kinase domain-containing protein n=1 Tax=Rhodococcus koreensis TaxID=99653 RepID=UPI00366ECE09
MVEGDPLETQRAPGPAVVAELRAAGFEDVCEVGRGGFGIVYRGVETLLDRTVAIKVLTADLDDDNRARFFREQQAMGRLTGHPNIVGVLHAGTTDSRRPYIVMQYHPRDSLESRIRRQGPLGLTEALRLGVKLAGALETAHRLGILHRDVKPGNILFTDYGEPALTDFGIAHIAGGFKTATGVVTGSPAFTAPEVLSGEAPSVASDVYGLGATLFCACTGHAAFERHSGEQVVAQFLRITTQPVPDLREQGIPDDVSAVIERSMSPDPRERPCSAAEFGDELRQVQFDHGLTVDEMALHNGPSKPRLDLDPLAARSSATGQRTPPTPPATRGAGDLPLELTSFVGRRRGIADTKEMLSSSRLVTLTGIGGVGKTRLALRVAADVRRSFGDGVCLVELDELRDESLLVDVVAAALGVRDRSSRPVEHAVADFLTSRRLLLVLDNCEHLVEAAAGLVEKLLRACPELHVLATSREPLGIGGEAVLRVPPLTIPSPERQPSLRGLPRYDAVTLFAERAATAVPGFELTEDNRLAVARICHRLDGLPLPIELAAARLRAMSADQILDRLTDRYALLTLGNRGAPTRQQTLRLSMDWSYELCTTNEQRVWARLSVFAGGFELDAAEQVCDGDLPPGDLLDEVTALIDKSILIREEAGAVVRFRMLETLRDYGRERLEQAGEYDNLRRRHLDWYQQLALDAVAGWISPRQLDWIGRLEREQPNLREAMDFALSREVDAEVDAGLRIATALYSFWLARALFSEGRHWLDRALASQPARPTVDRVRALYANGTLAGMQGDLPAETTLAEEAQALAAQTVDPVVHALAAHASGTLALFSGDPARACRYLDEALAPFDAPDDAALEIRISALLSLAWACQLQGNTPRAIACNEQALALTQTHGESVYQSFALWAMGVAAWRQGNSDRAVKLLKQGLTVSRKVDDPILAATCLETLAWTCDEDNAKRAATLMGAAEALGQSVGSSTAIFPALVIYHEECERQTRQALGQRTFEAAHRDGSLLSFDAAAAYALGEQPNAPVQETDSTSALTKREQQVADLVAEGLTNRAIATRLVISQRTAQGHVEHILTKLGFSSRAQIAAWVVERTRDTRPN